MVSAPAASTHAAAAPAAQGGAGTAPAAAAGAAVASGTAAAAGGPLAPLATAESQAAASRAVATLQPPNDLWERIRRGFAMPNLDTDLVRAQEQWYSTRPDYIQRMTERSRKYLFHIVEELERRNMPTELALLPFIESAFNPQAVSTAKAAGMWQFIPSTGRHFDLKQNLFRDDRRDVLASTRAALDYLQKLHGMFGDWHLALAAYNWGEGSVGRAIARNQKAGLATGYTDLNMPNETRHYVPKLQAVKNIVANPDAFRVDLPGIADHPYFQTVEIARDIDVALAARLADVKLEDFKALNPSANKPVILAAGTGQILLPWDNATVFERNLQAHDAGQLATWTAWTAPATLTVAAAAQRVGMSESEFRTINQIPPRMMIRAGSTVLVRRSPQQKNDVAEHVADNAQLSLAPEAGKRTTAKGNTKAAASKTKKASAGKPGPGSGAQRQAAAKGPAKPQARQGSSSQASAKATSPASKPAAAQTDVAKAR
ncbi:MAG: transglycosylase SLT domain-containing protein [Burkholderiaceae bacterium]